MVIDEKTWAVEPMPYMHWRVYVDGVEIRGVKYLDTEAGWVLSYCPLQDASEELLAAVAEQHDRVYRVGPEDQDTPRAPETYRNGKYCYGGRLDLASLLPKEWELTLPDEGEAIGRIFRGRVEVLPPKEDRIA
jgi:hypothetical protein